MQTGAEGNSTLVRIDLDITKSLVKVRGNDDVDGLDRTGEGLVQILLGDLKFEECAIDLVDDTDGLDTLTESLAEDGLGLYADTRNAVNNNKSAISDAKGSRDFGGEVNVARRIDQVNQELVSLDLLGNILDIFLVCQMGIQGNGGGLDGNAAVLFVCTRIGETSLAGFGSRDNTGTLNQRIGQGRLSMINYWELASAMSGL